MFLSNIRLSGEDPRCKKCSTWNNAMERSRSLTDIDQIPAEIGPYYDTYLVCSIKNITSHIQQIWDLYPNVNPTYRQHLYVALKSCTKELIETHRGILTLVTLTPQQSLLVMKNCDKALSICFAAGMKLNYRTEGLEDIRFLREFVKGAMPKLFTLHSGLNDTMHLHTRVQRLKLWGFGSLVKTFSQRYP